MYSYYLKIILLLCGICAINCTNAQHVYDKGFALLNTQNYTEAQTFFSEVLRDNPTDKTANICYARAIGLGGETIKGLDLFSELKTIYPNDFEVELNLAEAFMWNSDFESAQDQYWKLLQKDPGNFVANYGYANAQASLKNYDDAIYYNNEAIKIDPSNESATNARKFIFLGRAYDHFLEREFEESNRWIDTVLVYHPHEIDAHNIRNQIHEITKSYISSEVLQSQDEQNEAFSLAVASKVYLSPKVDFKSYFSSRKLKFLPESILSQQKIFNVGIVYHLDKRTQLEFSPGLNIVSEEDVKFAINHLVTAELRTQVSKVQHLSLKFNNEIYNYSALILRQDISLNHFSLTNHLQLSTRFGLYSKGIFTTFSDGNNRQFLFNSLYYSPILNRLKIGVNYSVFKYREDKSELYFSPLIYQSTELFTTLEGNPTKLPISYLINLSVGQQKIDQSAWRLSRRIEAKLNYHFKKKMTLSLHYLNSNVAQNLVIGTYNYSEIKLTCSYNIE